MTPKKYIVLWFCVSLLTGCASLFAEPWPALENRTLRISENAATLEYQDRVCVKRILGVCSKREIKKEIYDLNDPSVRKMLIQTGFVVRVREKQ